MLVLINLVIDAQMIMSTQAIFNRLPGLQMVSDKKQIASILQKVQRHYPDFFNFTPLTFSLASEAEQLQEYMAQSKGKTFIAKPSQGAEGLGIFLLKRYY